VVLRSYPKNLTDCSVSCYSGAVPKLRELSIEHEVPTALMDANLQIVSWNVDSSSGGWARDMDRTYDFGCRDERVVIDSLWKSIW